MAVDRALVAGRERLASPCTHTVLTGGPPDQVGLASRNITPARLLFCARGFENLLYCVDLDCTRFDILRACIRGGIGISEKRQLAQ
ncbi:MAG: hypothetical protein U5O16_25415 [Rhodococcus sp. (in: high G+C Gram-positive bacteria)]|uniref:hypothetical protein n=1 Tax=Rhodococcus sp. TaxID=1831 RepID=UPI002AD70020|nr:hypothetical protein [Rhodococcus sp. (in: high G+C Gram-positive bacteria)]